MQPHLVRWEHDYADRGLTVLYVAQADRTTPDALRQTMAASGATFPVVLDVSGATTRSYDVRAFPTGYVIGRDGTVVWEGIPHYDPSVPERAILSALAGAGPAARGR